MRADTDVDQLRAFEAFVTTGCVALPPLPSASAEGFPGGFPNVARLLAESASHAGLQQAFMLRCMMARRSEYGYAAPPWDPWLMQGPSLGSLLPTVVFTGSKDRHIPASTVPWGTDAIIVASASSLLLELAGSTIPSLYITQAIFTFKVDGTSSPEDAVLIPAHRLVLAAGSEMFATLFSGRWDGVDEGLRRCDCTDLPAHVVWAALCIAYTGRLPFDEPVPVCRQPTQRCKVVHVQGCCAQCTFMMITVEVWLVPCWGCCTSIDNTQVLLYCERLLMAKLNEAAADMAAALVKVLPFACLLALVPLVQGRLEGLHSLIIHELAKHHGTAK